MNPVPALVKSRSTSALALLLLLTAFPAAAQSLSPQPGEIEVEGRVTAVDRAARRLTLSVTAITQPGYPAITLGAARPKSVLFSAATSFSPGPASLEQIQVGSEIQVVGKDLGPGKELPARAILLTPSPATASTAAGAGDLDIQGPGNLARLAKVTASSCEGNTTPYGLTDGIIGGYPHDRANEWSSGQREGASVTLAWDTPQAIDTVALYNRAGGGDAVTAGEMTFEDGGKVVFGKLPDDPKTPLLVCFLPRPVRTLTITITGVRAGTYSSGFSEVAVFHTGKVDSSTPNLLPVARQLTLQEKLQAILDWDKAHPWNETIDWNKMDRLTSQLAPNRLDWNQLCIEATGRPLSSFGEALPLQDADRFLNCLIGHIKGIVARDGSKLTEMEWAILGCAVVPLQNGRKEGIYATAAGEFPVSRLGVAIVKMRGGINCGDSCGVAKLILLGLGIKAEDIDVRQKGGLHLRHAFVRFVEHDQDGYAHEHLCDPANMIGTEIGNNLTVFRPSLSVRFQLGGGKLDRFRMLLDTPYCLISDSDQGFDPPFTREELESAELFNFVQEHIDTKYTQVNPNVATLTISSETNVIYSLQDVLEIPQGLTPFARLYKMDANGNYQACRRVPSTGNSFFQRVHLQNRFILRCEFALLGPGRYKVEFWLCQTDRMEDLASKGRRVGSQYIKVSD